MQHTTSPFPQIAMEKSSSKPSDALCRYTYQPLEQFDHVRLMRFHPAKEQIECSIEQVPLIKAKFEALSYVWRSGEKLFRAIIRDARGQILGLIPLTRNLHDALCDLRDTPALKRKNFWIDQICINQDGEEKNDQVKLMGKIYESATKVIVYIGPAQSMEQEERGIQLLHEVDRRFAAYYKCILEKGNIWNAKVGCYDSPIATLPNDVERNYTANDWKWLANIASGPWYDRLWMVQEQLINSNVLMLRGRRLLAWDKVAALTILFGLELLPQQYWSPSAKLLILESTVYSFWRDRRDRCFEEASRRTFLQNINWYGGLECQDPRDHVYSLLGISSDKDELSIYPDYSEANTAKQLFLDTTVRILKAASDLSILGQACRFQHQFGLPSWVFSPSSKLRLIALPRGFSPHVRSILGYRPKFSANNTVLELRGSHVDEIEFLTPKIPSPEGDYKRPVNALWIQPITEYLSTMIKVLTHVGVTVLHAAALGRAMRMVYNGLDPNFKQSITVERAANYICREMRSWADEISMYSGQQSPCTTEILTAYKSIVDRLYQAIQSPYTQQDVSIQVDLPPREMELDLHCLLPKGVVFCVSKQGRIGIVQDEAMVGDVLTTFEGADRLYVLRTEGSRYRLIGGAYVDGLMDGEFYIDVDPSKADEVIKLV